MESSFPFGMSALLAILLLSIGERSVEARSKSKRRLSLSLEDRFEDLHRARTRIVGGAMVATNDVYPFFVNLGACAGTLVHGDIVLTAAHVSPFGTFIV
jgi:hypothetical protein